MQSKEDYKQWIILIAPAVYSWYIDRHHEDELLLVVVGAGDDSPRKGLDHRAGHFRPLSIMA